jgi:methylenetetrahydrofolate dehydrogenase (NADP+)/methenyltetrahydrofolate cyclohydrolase
MSAQIIDGKSVAAGIRAAAKAEAAALGFRPGFAAVLVGDDPASETYVRLKEKACAEAGLRFEKLLVRADAGQDFLLRVIDALNRRDDIDATLLQLPLPAGHGYDADAAIAAIDPAKDVDGFHAENLRLLKEGRPRLVPGLPAGIAELIKATGVPLAGRAVLVVANSPIFFEPLEIVLASLGLMPGFATPDDPEIAAKTKNADVLIVAVGRPNFVRGDMVKPGAVVIDVGTNKVPAPTPVIPTPPSVIPAPPTVIASEAKQSRVIVGDVDAASVAEVAAFLTPVPGGVGPMTVAMVVANAVRLAKASRQK